MNFRLKLLCLWLLGSSLVGGISKSLPEHVSDTQVPQESFESLGSLSAGLGQGLSLAVLGGYRHISANFVWVSMYGDWRYRRQAEVLEKMRLAVALNPHSGYFWLDGARIIANDMPVWAIGEAQAGDLFETEKGRSIRADYAQKALAFLDLAPEHISHSIEILVERGAIYWKRLDDLPSALACFEQATAIEGVPYYVCRVYAELLIKDGQIKEASRYLKKHYQALPDDDPRALKPFVKRRIEELESQLVP